MNLKKHIPNTITCCNLLSGCVALHCAFSGHPNGALLFIVAGAVFDFFDGFAARLCGVSSPVGKELDSLADVVTFGVAPAALVFWLLSAKTVYPAWLLPIEDYVPYIAFLPAAFSALRLAKFNLDVRQTSSFIGLPTPANALFWGALVWEFGERMGHSRWAIYVCVLLIFLSCYLLVAEIPMFALKFKRFGLKENRLRYFFLLTSLLLICTGGVGGIAVVILWYVLLSIAASYFNRISR